MADLAPLKLKLGNQFDQLMTYTVHFLSDEHAARVHQAMLITHAFEKNDS